MASSRVTITVPTYMPLDGQGQIVYPGSVVDVPAGQNYSSACCTPVNETAGAVAPHGKPSSVRNVRTR